MNKQTVARRAVTQCIRYYISPQKKVYALRVQYV